MGPKWATILVPSGFGHSLHGGSYGFQMGCDRDLGGAQMGELQKWDEISSSLHFFQSKQMTIFLCRILLSRIIKYDFILLQFLFESPIV